MRFTSIALLAALCAACSSYRTDFDYDTEFDFATLRTYAWLPPPPELDSGDLLTRRVRAAVDEELAAKGMRPVDSEPDFQVAFHAGTQSRIRVNDWGYGYDPHFDYWGGRRVDVYEYEEGTLVLDFVDAAQKELVWRGSATRRLQSGLSPEERDERIREAVAALLERFPPDPQR